jgi:hypothetical protein
MRGLLKLAGTMVAAVVLLANSACFAACAVESCAQSKVRPCHKHKPTQKTADIPCFSRTVIAPLPADATLKVTAADSGPVLASQVLAAEELALASVAAWAHDPPESPLVLRI